MLSGSSGSIHSEASASITVKVVSRGTADIALRDGDTIFVPEAELVYVFGQVNNPGSYPIKRNTTVLQALSLAGGATENAYHVVTVRWTGRSAILDGLTITAGNADGTPSESNKTGGGGVYTGGGLTGVAPWVGPLYT